MSLPGGGPPPCSGAPSSPPGPSMGSGDGGKSGMAASPLGQKNKNRNGPPNGGPFLLCVWIERGLRDVRSCVCKHFFLTLLILLLFLEPLVNGL